GPSPGPRRAGPFPGPRPRVSSSRPPAAPAPAERLLLRTYPDPGLLQRAALHDDHQQPGAPPDPAAAGGVGLARAGGRHAGAEAGGTPRSDARRLIQPGHRGAGVHALQGLRDARPPPEHHHPERPQPPDAGQTDPAQSASARGPDGVQHQWAGPTATQRPPTSSPYPTGSSTQAPQQMTVNIVNQPALHKPTSGPQVVNHSGSIMIHSPLGQQQQQGSLPPGQYLLPSSLALTPGTTTQALQALNGQVLHTQLQGTADPASTNSTYSGTFLTNQSAAVQLVSGQNFAAGGQLIVNQAVVSGQLGQASPALVQVSQAVGAHPKNQLGFTSSTPGAPTPVQSGYTLVNSSDTGYTQQGVQARPQVSVSLGHHFLVPLPQDGTHTGVQGTSEPQFETQSYHQTQVSHSLSPALKQPQLQSQPQLVNLLGSKAGKPSISLETVVCLPNQVGSPHVPNAQMTKLKRPAPQQLTKGGMVLQQLRQDQGGVLAGSRSPFSSMEDAVHRLLPYHVFQGAPPSDDDFHRVDEEFETVATHVLKRTEAMLNKYRRLLLVDAERTSPSSEMVMIDRTFNQEERGNLTQDKRLALVDPDGFLEEFCCPPKPVDTAQPWGVQAGQEALVQALVQAPDQPSPAQTLPQEDRDSACGGRGREGPARPGADPSLRTELQPGAKDPGGEQPEVSLNEHLETAIKSILQLKRTQGRGGLTANAAPAPAPAPPPAPGLLPPRRAVPPAPPHPGPGPRQAPPPRSGLQPTAASRHGLRAGGGCQ
ncbi:hypothetical protein COCON_G00225470, partial [Conger conger]